MGDRSADYGAGARPYGGGDREGPAPPTRLFVGGLATTVEMGELREMFAPHGEIVRLQVKNTDNHVNYAFVEYETQDDAARAINALNDKAVHGRTISVSQARGPRNSRQDSRGPYGAEGGHGRGGGYGRGGGRFERGTNGRAAPPGRVECQVEVNNVSSDASWQDLKDLARTTGASRVMFADIVSAGVGLIEYSNEAEAQEALKVLGGKTLKGTPVSVRTPDTAYNGVGGPLKGFSRDRERVGRGDERGGYGGGLRGYDPYPQPPRQRYADDYHAPPPREREYDRAPPPRADPYAREYDRGYEGRAPPPEPYAYERTAPSYYARERDYDARGPPPARSYDDYDARRAPPPRYAPPERDPYYDAPPPSRGPPPSRAPPPSDGYPRYEQSGPPLSRAPPPADDYYRGPPREYYPGERGQPPARGGAPFYDERPPARGGGSYYDDRPPARE